MTVAESSGFCDNAPAHSAVRPQDSSSAQLFPDQLVSSQGNTSNLPRRKFSSSTNIDFLTVENDALSKRLSNSVEGRFTIIDKRYKDSTDDSFDDDSDVVEEMESPPPHPSLMPKSSSAFFVTQRQPNSKNFDPTRSVPNFKKMAINNVSRFKIVPVESRYKRGRWQAWDYYLDKKTAEGEAKNLPHTLTTVTSTNLKAQSQLNPPKMIAIVPPTPPSVVVSLPSTKLSDVRSDVEPDTFSTFAFDTKSSSPHRPTADFYIPSNSSTIHSNGGQNVLLQDFLSDQGVADEIRKHPEIFGSRPNSPDLDLQSEKNMMPPEVAMSSLPTSTSRANPYRSSPQPIHGGRLTPSAELLLQQYGLERSLSATSSYHDPTNYSLLDLLPSSAESSQNNKSKVYQFQQLAFFNCIMGPSAYYAELQQRLLDDAKLSSLFYNGVQKSSVYDVYAPDYDEKETPLPDQATSFHQLSSSINGGGPAAATSPTASLSSSNAQNAQIVAIDSKIEQAMDLVKTHLMFAVREEVESLRNKILELETTVVQLEAENSILREHVPTEILQNLALHSGNGAATSSAQSTLSLTAQ